MIKSFGVSQRQLGRLASLDLPPKVFDALATLRFKSFDAKRRNSSRWPARSDRMS